MPIQIGQKPAPTFQQPLELLSDCHRRIESFLGDLILVAERARGGPLQPVERTALETALRYFREAAPRHVADEEESLFPRLRECASDAARAALASVMALENDHRSVERDHAVVDQIGRRWLDTGRIPYTDVEILTLALKRLKATYDRHIAVEDHEVFPAAAQALEPAVLAAIGAEMAARRRAR